MSTAVITAIAREIKSHLGLDDFQIGITFVGSRAIRTLNHRFRDRDKVTDVLSFPQIDWQRPVPVRRKRKTNRGQGDAFLLHTLGDIVISIPEAERNAAQIGQSLERELCFLVVHGFLHLCGYDHMVPKDEAIMLRAQRVLMQRLGEGTRRPLWRNCVKTTLVRRKRAR